MPSVIIEKVKAAPHGYGFDDTGTLLGGVQIQLAPAETRTLYLPIVRKS